MKKTDYIIIGNQTKMRMAERILRDILPGNDFGVEMGDYTIAVQKIAAMGKALEAIVNSRIEEMDLEGEINSGDWTTLETVEIGDTIGCVKIETENQKQIVREAGSALRCLPEDKK